MRRGGTAVFAKVKEGKVKEGKVSGAAGRRPQQGEVLGEDQAGAGVLAIRPSAL